MPEALGRLKKRSEFLRVAASGRKWVTPGLILQARRRDTGVQAPEEAEIGAQAPKEAGPPDHCEGSNRKGSPSMPAANAIRVGYTTSRKVGPAVDRNRARRRLRAAVAEVMLRDGQSGTDYVVIGRKSTLGRPFAALVQDLSTALRRLAEREARDGKGGGKERGGRECGA